MRITLNPDMEVTIVGEDIENTLQAESISQTGKTMCIIPVALIDGKLSYSITHVPTGMDLSGERMSLDIESLKTRARRLWRFLSYEQQAAFKTDDQKSIVEICRQNSTEIIEILRG